MDKLNKYRFLFHVHTYKSFDATISYQQLYKTLEINNITHLAITEHNNMDSYEEFKKYLKEKSSNVVLIPAIEYTTKVGDIIAMNITDIINFTDYLDLVRKIKDKGGTVILPHPYKRKLYPKELFNYLDFYEIVNMRGVGKSFNAFDFKGINQIFGSDAHNFLDLPGVINTFSHKEEFFKALHLATISPEIITSPLSYGKFISKVISKIKRNFIK